MSRLWDGSEKITQTAYHLPVAVGLKIGALKVRFASIRGILSIPQFGQFFVFKNFKKKRLDAWR